MSMDAVAEEVTHQVIDESCQLAGRLLTTAESLRTRRDTATRRRFARLLDDPDGLAVTMALADEVMRTPSSREAARILRRSAKLARARGLGVIDAVGLRLLAVASALAAAPVMNVIAQTVRMRANGIILPADARRLTRHIRRRRDDRARLNINVLGEAVLGDNEADTRYRAVMEMIARPDVDYVSVKLSAIVAQLITVDRDGSLNRIAERLRPLYRAAMGCNTFVNLDMEEYRDLEITLRSFMSILDEPEFERLTAGIVLQAYLPEAHEALQRLTSWARARHARSGGVIKVRLVKGANLAMESTEAELHGWVAAPYSTKSDVDASYVRMLDSVVNERDAVAVRVGVASHNLFHLAFALTLAKRRGVSSQIDIEMLEGMANAEALALARETGSVILYTPVTSRDDFPAAVAYLVRRLDENTSTENYLRASFSMHPGNDAWRQQQLRFVASVRESATISTTSRRHGLVRTDADAEFGRLRFANQGDGDPTNITELPFGATVQIPQVDVATANEVGSHVATARRAQAEWAAAGATKRAEILRVAARIMQQERRDTIALMMREAGKTFAEADPEVSEAIDFARFYAL
ncbi:MAG: proline dehydrogenase family protein, partial [Actinomycetota bacterium]